MEKKCPHHNRLLCRNSRREALQDSNHAGRPSVAKVRRMKIFISPTTGGQLEVCVSQNETVRGLKQLLARKYRITPARISLLCRERVLKDGSLQDNEVHEGSRLVLCPNMESGTASSHAEHSVIQALRNLSDLQIRDFLTGRSPLTLAIRLGEHLLFVQLQLSTTPSRSLSVQPTPPASAPASPTPTTGSRDDGGVSRDSGVRPMYVPTINPLSLLQASHNLTEKLKELTHLTQQTLQAGVHKQQAVSAMPPTPPPSPPPSPGAVIDSMQHMGKGIYSGTFSGTLDPRLQDRSGQPRRDVNTILHILHDLLVAQPSSQIAPRHPHGNQPTSTPRSPGEDGGENEAMRDKVQRVQRMLELRRQRRSARRQNQRPYPSHASHCNGTSSQSSSISSFLTTDTSSSHTAAGHAENVETSNYRKPNMEQETVAV